MNHIHDAHTDTIRLIHAHAAPRCQHVKTNGLRCQSPAMKRRKFCFYHEKSRPLPAHRLELPLLEDANAVQMAIQQVARNIAQGSLDNKRAGLLLYALQTAALNLKNCDFEPDDGDAVVLDSALDTLDQQQSYDPDSPSNTLDSDLDDTDEDEYEDDDEEESDDPNEDDNESEDEENDEEDDEDYDENDDGSDDPNENNDDEDDDEYDEDDERRRRRRRRRRGGRRGGRPRDEHDEDDKTTNTTRTLSLGRANRSRPLPPHLSSRGA